MTSGKLVALEFIKDYQCCDWRIVSKNFYMYIRIFRLHYCHEPNFPRKKEHLELLWICFLF